jgi:putative transposase
MPRANRIFSPGRVWHITHRCHQREFLLKFARDRRRWRHWLFEARRRYGLSILNYVATSNHVHLLCEDQGRGEIPRGLQLSAGRTAQEFNARKNRKGAFWEDRYHATAVQTDGHLARCITYIDLNMVRAHVVRHPGDWEVCGYNEIQNPKPRKRVIDFEALLRLLNVDSHKTLVDLQNHLVQNEISHSKRNPIWTESIAIGDTEYLEGIKLSLGSRGTYRQIAGEHGSQILREPDAGYHAVFDGKLGKLGVISAQISAHLQEKSVGYMGPTPAGNRIRRTPDAAARFAAYYPLDYDQLRSHAARGPYAPR